MVLGELKKHWRDYDKGVSGAFSRLTEKLNVAIGNAKKGCRDAQDSGGDNPTTYVFELVEYLRDLK